MPCVRARPSPTTRSEKESLAVAQEPGKALGQTGRQAPGASQKSESQDSSGLPAPPDLPRDLHDPESPPGRRASQCLDRERQGQRTTPSGQDRLHPHESLGRRAALVREPDHQRHPGRLQQPSTIRQGQSARLPYPQELHQHGLPDPRHAGSQAAHMKRRRALFCPPRLGWRPRDALATATQVTPSQPAHE